MGVILIKERLERKYGIPLRERDNSFNGHCPFCHLRGKSPDREYHFYIYKNSGFVYCPRCGYKSMYRGDEDDEFSYDEYLDRFVFSLYKKSGGESSVSEVKEFNIDRYKRVERGSFAYDYLMSRRFTDELIRYYDVRDDQKNCRVIFPIKEYGRVISAIGRTYINDPVKYFFPSSFRKSEYIYNIDSVVSSSYVVLAEGVISAIFADKNRCGVATFGKEITYSQIEKLKKTSVKRVYVAYEWDDLDNVFRQCNKLVSFFEVYVCNMPYRVVGNRIEYLDPNDVEFNYEDAFLYTSQTEFEVRNRLNFLKL